MFSHPERGALLVAGTYGARGGLELQLRHTAVALATRVPVTVLTWSGHRPQDDGVQVVPAGALIRFDRDRGAALARVNTILAVASGLAHALRLRRRWSVALAAGLHPEGTVAALACLLLRRRFVVTTWLPGPVGNVARLERSLGARAIRGLLRRGGAYAVETDEMADELVASGFRRDRVHVIGNSTDVDRFAPVTAERRAEAKSRLGLGGARLLSYCGRFDLRQKRLDLLLDGWRQAAPHGWRLLLLGDGLDRRSVERLASGIDPAVLIPGWHDDVTPFLAASDACALATNFEGLSGALVEALACGLPTLLSRTPGFERTGLDGVVLVTNEGASWAEAIVRMTSASDAERAELGALGRAWALRHADQRTRDATIARLLGVD